MAVYTLEQFKALPRAKKPGMPMVVWACTGGTRSKGIKSGDELRGKLAEGMDEHKIDELNETKRGQAVMNEYLGDREKRNKQVKEESSGVFDTEEANGDHSKTYVADDKTGKVHENINE